MADGNAAPVNFISTQHRAAREAAASGLYVFPCVENGKAPAHKGGFDNATRDAGQIDAWWAENSKYNIGCDPTAVAMVSSTLTTKPTARESRAMALLVFSELQCAR